MFGNSVQGRMSGPKREEVTGGWRKLPNKELQNLYSENHIITMKKAMIK
jgi:hypothetical protein